MFKGQSVQKTRVITNRHANCFNFPANAAGNKQYTMYAKKPSYSSRGSQLV